MQLYDVGCAPHVILPLIAEDLAQATPCLQDIYNLVKKDKRQQLDGRSPLQTLIDQLDADDQYRYRTMINESGSVTYLYIIDVIAMEMLARFLSILQVDCTYKTNRYKMLLLNTLSVTNLNTTFVVGLACLSGELESD